MTLRFMMPAAWWLLAPWAFAAWRLLRRDRRPAGILFSALPWAPEAPRTWRMRLAAAHPFILLAGLWLLIAAAARPQGAPYRIRRHRDAIAMAMVVDVSGSMRALDFSDQTTGERRSRLDVVKQTFREFIHQRPDDLIALITFGGFVSTRSPLTADHRVLLHLLDAVEIPDPEANDQVEPEELMTAIGDALATACARLRNAEPKTRIIVLLSDGESNAGIIEPETAAEIAATMEIPVYTVGVGSNDPVPFPARDALGRETLTYVQIPMDEPMLRHIAERTGGRYFFATDTAGLENALAEIDHLQTDRVEDAVVSISRDHFMPFAAGGTLLSALAIVLGLSLLQRPA